MVSPTWEETLLELHRAETVPELWMVLITPHGLRGSALWEEPIGLFRMFHEHDTDGVAMTAALLCTDYRWRKGARLVVEQLVASGLLDAAMLDELAEWFLRDKLVVSVPSELFVGVEVIIGEVPRTADGDVTTSVVTDGVVNDLLFARSIWPPLRRWAARHAVETASERWRVLLDAVRALPTRDAAATAAGVMDAAGHVGFAERGEALAVGLGWGSGTVRLAALPALAELEGLDAARARAASDVSAKVRAWAVKTASAEHARGKSDGDDNRGPAARNTGGVDRATLF
jgi:hypothetical protein